MDTFQQAVAESPSLVHTRIAKDAFPNGAEARCLKCGTIVAMNHDDLVRMMQFGIPRCCGQRMQVEAIK